MLIQIRREALAPATFGTMQVDGEPFGFTLELPWKDNKPQVSCIPAGLYALDITYSNRFNKRMLEIVKVPGRQGIRIHNANFPHQLLGCIAVARKRINDEYIAQGISQALFDLVKFALSEKETVILEILNPVNPKAVA